MRFENSSSRFARPNALAALAVLLGSVGCAAGCSSSSEAPADGKDSGVADAPVDVKPDTATSHDATPTPDTSADDTNPPSLPDVGGGGDGKIDKCAGVSCGIYERCCPSSGKCYDTRTGVCY